MRDGVTGNTSGFELEDEGSTATVNRELQVLSKVFSMAYDNGLVETNPVRRVRRLREDPARERYLTDDEEKRIFEALVFTICVTRLRLV